MEDREHNRNSGKRGRRGGTSNGFEYNLVDVETNNNKKKVHLVSPCHDYHYLLRLKEAQQLLDQKHE